MATNRDLLKEAIADAKAVKEMAIANAKTALEEAFTPRLKEMLSAKIQEMDEEDSKSMEEMKYEEDDTMEEGNYYEDDTKVDEAKEEVEEAGFEPMIAADDDQGFDSLKGNIPEGEEDLDEMDLEELLAELEEEEKVEESLNEAEEEDEVEDEVEDEEESKEEEGEPLDLEDMTDEDLKKMIEDVIADMVASGELEGGDVEGEEEEGEEMEMSDEEEEVDLTELLKEIEEEMTEEESILDTSDSELKAAADKIAKAFDSGKLDKEDLPTKDEVEKVITPSDVASIKSALEEALMLHEGDETTLNEEKEKAKAAIDAEIKQLAKTKKVAKIAKIAGLSVMVVAGIVALTYLPAVAAAGATASVLSKGAMTAAGVKLATSAGVAGVGLATGTAGAAKEFSTKGRQRNLQRAKAKLEEELYEAKAEIESLKSDLNEAVKETNATNLLNAKLLYTNKIFKAKNLNESQKVKVLSSFDKANTTKEAKLIYETLNEGLKVKKSTIKENLGRASKATTIPTTKKPIVESNDVFARMQKLAGIIK